MAAPMKEDEVGTLEQFIEGLRILTISSASRRNLSEDESQQLMDNVLHQNLVTFANWWIKSGTKLSPQNSFYYQFIKLIDPFIEKDTSPKVVEVRRKFADVCIVITKKVISLFKIKEEIHKEKTQNEEGTDDSRSEFMLSMNQEKIVSISLQFVIVLGVSPYLSQGVGVPISHRLGPGQILLASANDYTLELSEVKRLQYLLPALHLLVDAFHSVGFHGLIVKNHLSDLITLLIQVRRTAKIVLQHHQTCAGCDKTEFHPHSEVRQDGEKQEELKHLCSPSSLLNFSNNGVDYDVVSNSNHCVNCLHRLVSYCNSEIEKLFSQQSVMTLLQEMLTLAGLNKAGKNIKMAPWFKRVVSSIIRDLIMLPSGVLQLISHFMSEFACHDTKDWKTCEAIARVISHCPVTPINVKDFIVSVSHQLVEIIQVGDRPVPQMVIKIVGDAIAQLTHLQKDLMEELCLSGLREPLHRCCSFAGSRSNGDVLVSEKELTSTISCMHRLYVQGQGYQSQFCSTLQPVVGVIFAVFKHVKTGASPLRSLTKDLLNSYLSCLDTSKGVACLLELLTTGSKYGRSYPTLLSDLVLQHGPDSGIKVVVACDERVEDVNNWSRSPEAVLELLTSVKSESLTSELFITLLQRLTDLVSTEVRTFEDIILPVHCLSLQEKSSKLTELRSKTELVSLISAIAEKYGHAVVNNTHHILLFTRITLGRCLEVMKASDEGTTLTFETDTVTMAMGLLMATLSMAPELSEEDKNVLDDLLPMLSSFSCDEDMPPHMREMAENLKVVVATRGLVWPDLSKNVPASQEVTHLEKEKEVKVTGGVDRQSASKPPLIEVLSEKKACDFPKESKAEATKPPGDTSPKGLFQQAIDDIESSLLPVQGHGLIALTRLLKDRQTDAVQQKDALLKIFLKNLSHSDSYIYLASVNGLSALGDLCPDEVIPCLCSEFQQLCLKTSNSATFEATLKVGEALVKATRRLGEMIPKYRDILLPAILCGCRHDNELVRASCLSGLAEVCKLLRFSIKPVVQEVLMCCRDVVKSDPCCEPRRAAGLTITSLLQGLGKDSLEALNTSLTELYRALKHAVNFDSDEKVKMHATLALNELEDIMKDALFPQQKLQKTISILGYQ